MNDITALSIEPHEMARSIVRYGIFTPSERLVMLALAVSERVSSTVQSIRTLTGATREQTLRTLNQLVSRGILAKTPINYPPTTQKVDIYRIDYVEPTEPPIVFENAEGFVESTELHWSLVTGTSFAQAEAELAEVNA